MSERKKEDTIPGGGVQSLPAESQLVSLSPVSLCLETFSSKLHEKHLEHLFELYSVTT